MFYSSDQVFNILSNMLHAFFRKEKTFKDNFNILVSGFYMDAAFIEDWNEIVDNNNFNKNILDIKSGYKISYIFIKYYSELIKFNANDDSLIKICNSMQNDIDTNKYDSIYWKVWCKCWYLCLTNHWYNNNDETKYDLLIE